MIIVTTVQLLHCLCGRRSYTNWHQFGLSLTRRGSGELCIYTASAVRVDIIAIIVIILIRDPGTELVRSHLPIDGIVWVALQQLHRTRKSTAAGLLYAGRSRDGGNVPETGDKEEEQTDIVHHCEELNSCCTECRVPSCPQINLLSGRECYDGNWSGWVAPRNSICKVFIYWVACDNAKIFSLDDFLVTSSW